MGELENTAWLLQVENLSFSRCHSDEALLRGGEIMYVPVWISNFMMSQF